MRSSKSLRRKPSRRLSKNSRSKDRLAPRLRALRIEGLEPRRMLATNPFSTYADQLSTDVTAIQTTLDTTLDTVGGPLTSLPFIGSQLGQVDQVKSAIDGAAGKINIELSSFSMTGAQAGDLQNELYKVFGSPSYTQNGQVLAPNGLDLLGGGNDGANSASVPSDIHVTNFNLDPSGILETADVEMRLHLNATLGSASDLTFNLGLPALPFKIMSTGGLQVTVGFDYELAVNYSEYASPPISMPVKNVDDFSPSLTAHQMVISLSAGFAPATSLTAELGFLEGQLVPTGSASQNQVTASVTVDNLSLNSAPDIAFSGNANLNLQATLTFGSGSTAFSTFPSIGTTFIMNWGDLTKPSTTLSLTYGDVKLNLGQFVSNLVEPVLADIQQYTEPLQSAVSFLNKPIPGIDSIPGLGNFSLMSIINTAGDVTGFGPLVQVVDQVEKLVTLVNSFNINTLTGVSMDMGSFNLDGQAIAADPTAALDPSALSELATSSLSNLDLTDDLASDAQTAIAQFGNAIASKIGALGLPNIVTNCLDAFAQDLTGGAYVSVDFPLFDNPGSIINLLFGKDVDLVSFKAGFNIPSNAFSFPTGVSFLGLSLNFNGNFSASGMLQLGYDTYGLRELVSSFANGTPSAGQIASDIADGFYILGPNAANPADQDGKPDPLGSYVSVAGTVGLGLGASLGLASVNIDGGLFTGSNGNNPISLSLNDQHPDSANDGKIRLPELEWEIQHGSVFNATGEVDAGLYIQATIGFGPFSYSDTLANIATVTLWSSSQASNSAVIASMPPPTINSISPAQGPAGGGTIVTIYGSNLGGVTDVVFAAVGLSGGPYPNEAYGTIVPGSIGPDSLEVATPLTSASGVTQAGMAVDSPSGSAGTPIFSYLPPPSITALSNASGPAAGGALVDLTGTNFYGVTGVKFGTRAGIVDTAAEYLAKDSVTSLWVLSPPGSGTVDVTVVTPGGTSSPPSQVFVDPDAYVYIPTPNIESISPNSGPTSGVRGYENAVLTGTNLDNASLITVGAASEGLDYFQIVSTASDGTEEADVEFAPTQTTSGTVNVTVTTPGGTSNPSGTYLSTGLLHVLRNDQSQFTYFAQPVITSVAPDAGPETPLFAVAIDGQNLSGATAVTFGNTPALSFSYNPFNPEEIDATPPAVSQAGTVPVTVTTAGGTSGAAPYTYTESPIVSEVTPSVGALAGGTLVTILGSNLLSATELQFGKFTAVGIVTPGTIYRADFFKDTGNEIQVYSPYGGNIGTEPLDVQVLGAPGCYSALSTVDNFTYVPAPVVTGVSPGTGAYYGGTTVTITGNYLTGASTVVYFGALRGTDVQTYGSYLTVTSPFDYILGQVDVTVATIGGTSPVNPAYTYTFVELPPVVESLAPPYGSDLGGTTVAIYGLNLLETVGVKFGATPALGYSVVSDTEVMATSPAGAVGNVDVTVTTNDGTSATSSNDLFSYTPVPAVTGISTSSGPIGGGTSVTITGNNFAISPVSVYFGQYFAASAVVVSPTEIMATSPSESAGTVDIFVANRYGDSATIPADQFTFVTPLPVVTHLDVDTGSTGGGTQVTITGTNLSGIESVKFGNSYATIVQGTNTATQIEVDSPPSPDGATGGTYDITVMTVGGTSVTSPLDEFVYGGAPTILYIEPNVYPTHYPSGPAPEPYDVAIVGANLDNPADPSDPSSGVTVLFGTYADQNQTNVGFINVDSPDIIYVTPPSVSAQTGGVGTVDVRVETPDGESVITSGDLFTFATGPIVTTLATGNTEGPVAGGTTVTIMGDNLSDATAVDFNGVPAASFTAGASITAITPAGAAGTVNVTVTTPEGTSPVLYTWDQFTYVGIPTISGISPATGPLGGGNEVVIAGSGLSDINDVTVDFGGVSGTFLNGYGTDSELFVDAPAGAALGSVDVTVTTVGGTVTDPSAYTYLPPPAVTGLSQTSGAYEGGSTVTITGTGLADVTEVDFGAGHPATIVSNTDMQMVVVSPYSPLHSTNYFGTVDVTVISPNGTSATSSADQFTYANAPYIDHVGGPLSLGYGMPAGLIAGGDYVTIYGNDLDGATAVTFGGASATIVNDFADQMQVIDPAGVLGKVDIAVTTPNGTTDISSADQFTYVATPTVSGINTSSGTTAGGTQVTIAGSGLANATQVRFQNGYEEFIGTITSDADNQLVITTPSSDGYEGVYDIVVETPFGYSPTSAADQFTFVAPPRITYIPYGAGGPVTGGTLLTIDGADLANASEVDVGSNPATIIPGTNSNAQIEVLTPEATGDSPGTVNVTVTTPYGTSDVQLYNDQFTYALAPAVTGLSQTAGRLTGGASVIISGTNLSGATEADFGGVAATSITDESNGTILAVSPAGLLSTVDVTVVTPAGTSATSSADLFSYVDVPSVSDISPTEGKSLGGDTVTIFGAGLANATEVYFDGGYPASIVSNTDSQIVITTPPGIPAYDYLGTFDIQVVTAGGTSNTSAADQFTYVAAPSVTDLSTPSGSRDGGASVSVVGTNLLGATVYFGQNVATIVDDSDNEVDVVAPAGTVGTVDVAVTTPGGTSSTSTADRFTYFQPPPAVTGLSQTDGAAAGGTAITITGTDLDGATEVVFGGVAGTIVAGSDTATQITATVPPGTVGTVDVTVVTPGGTSSTTSADQFTGISAPAITSTESAFGPLAGNTDVFIYGMDLEGATEVHFGSQAGTILFDAHTYVVAASPAGSVGAVDMTVTTPYGTSAAAPSVDRFTYVAAPTAVAASYSTLENTTLTVLASIDGVLTGDTDPQGLPLSATLLNGTTNGSLSLGSDGSFTYTPASGFLGTDSFTYEATNGYVDSSPATVTITVNPRTLTWTGTTGNWTDGTWSAGPSAYPDNTVNAVVGSGGSGSGGSGSLVNVTSAQAANALTVQSGGQVSVAAGADLSVTTDTSVTGGATLSVDPNGFFSTGGTLTLDMGGSLTGGPVNAAAYQLNDGTVSANLSGPGGVTKDTGGMVTLSGINTYLGNTVVDNGVLNVLNSASLPDGSSLTVGAGAASIFGSALMASMVASPTFSAPVSAAPAASSSPIVASGATVNSPLAASARSALSPVLEGQVKNPPSLPVVHDSPAAMSSAAVDAVFGSHRWAFGPAVSTPNIAPARTAWTWPAAVESFWNSPDLNKTTDFPVAAPERILAREGV
jgi:hypothetical protein